MKKSRQKSRSIRRLGVSNRHWAGGGRMRSGTGSSSRMASHPAQDSWQAQALSMRWHGSSRDPPLDDRSELPSEGLPLREWWRKSTRCSYRARIRLIVTRNARRISPMRPEGSADELYQQRLLRRTSISSIPAGIQRLYSISKVTAERSCSSRASPERSVAMSSISISKRSTRFAAVAAPAVVLLGLLSPPPSSDPNTPAVLTSHSPWLSPTAPRQPARADVPQNEILSAWEREQQVLHAELDRKLIICRGC